MCKLEKMTHITRRILYAALTVCSLAFAAFIFLNGTSKSTLPELRERTGALADDPAWPIVKAEVAKLQTELQAKPGDARTLLQLAKAFMQEGRVTGEFTYYNKAALTLIGQVLTKEPRNFEAICLKSMVYLSQHRFAEAKELASQAAQVNPHNSFIYGLLCDAHVELGNYPEAVAVTDKMVGIRPDIRSYSRVSYLREIHGDAAGAIEAIQMAVKSGYPGQEDTEWARMVLAHLYEDTGALDKAEQEYQTALAERPNYPFALAGLGKIARYRKDYPAAIRYLEQARTVMADAAFFEELIDLYQLNGQPDKAAECARVTIAAMLSDNISANKNRDEGHYSDLELAHLYLKTNDLEKAHEHARLEHARRPENIDACETLAWVLFKQGKYAEADPFMQKALRTHSQKPERLARAGLLKKALGQQAEGDALLAQARALKPYLDDPQQAAELKK